MYHQQQLLSYEINWANTIKSTIKMYGIEMDQDQIQAMSKAKWKELVDCKVEQAAFHELMSENASKKKTSDLQYEKLQEQKYAK